MDRVYMTFVQATTGSGGWPMSVWLTPELKPFAGGTYFPPEDRYGRPGFKTVLQRLAEIWRTEPERVARARRTDHRHAARLRRGRPPDRRWNAGPEVLQNAFRQAAQSFDADEGGFGGAPKFPRPVLLDFLLGFYESDRTGRDEQRARDMVFHDPAQNGAGRHARSSRRRLSPLLRGSLLARAAFRKNALRPGPTGAAATSPPGGSVASRSSRRPRGASSITCAGK